MVDSMAVTFIGVELPKTPWRNDNFNQDNSDEVVYTYGPESLQARFAAVPAYLASNGQRFEYTVEPNYPDANSDIYDEDESFGGYAGFDLSDLPLLERARAVQILPELAAVIVARLASLRLSSVSVADVKLYEYTYLY